MNEHYCVECAHFQECLKEYQLEYEELHENSICGNFEEYIKE